MKIWTGMLGGSMILSSSAKNALEHARNTASGIALSAQPLKKAQVAAAQGWKIITILCGNEYRMGDQDLMQVLHRRST